MGSQSQISMAAASGLVREAEQAPWPESRLAEWLDKQHLQKTICSASSSWKREKTDLNVSQNVGNCL